MALPAFQPLRFCSLASVASIILGTVWLILWFSGVAPRWGAEGAITVKTNMALAQVLGGLSLLLLGSPGARPLQRRLGQAFATIVLLVGMVTLSEHIFQYNAGIDQLFAIEPPGAAATASPNRIGPPGSLSLMLLGAGLLLLASRLSRFAPWLGLATCVINLIPAVGFLYGIAEFYSNPRLTGIAWSTVIALFSLGAGLILARPAQRPVAQLRRDDLGGVLLRRLVPAVVLIPLALGFLRVQGEVRGYYETAAGTGTLTIVMVLGFLFILWRTAATLSETAEAKAKAEAELRESEARAKVSQAVEAERRRFNDVLNMMPAYVILLSPDYRVPFANRFFEERFGKSNGRRCYEYLFNRNEPCENCETFKVLKTKAPHDWEWAGPDGRNYEIHDFPFTDADGSPLIMEVGLDITERKRAQEELERTTEILRAISENSPDLVFAKDCEGRVVFASQSTLRVLGKTAAEVLGKTDPEIHADPCLGEAVGEHDRAVRETRQPLVVEEPTRLPDGSLRVFHSTKVPWIARDGTLAGTFGIAVDITRLKEVEAGLKDANERLEKRVAERTAELQKSEECFRGFFEDDLSGDYVATPEGRIVLCNSAFVRIYGFTSPQEAIGACVLDVKVHPENWARLLKELKEHRIVERFESEHRRRDGAVIHIVQNVVGTFDATGELREVRGYVFDETERNRATGALRESEKRYRSLFESIDEGFCILEMMFDREGRPNNWRYLEVNPAFERHNGLEQATGRTIVETVPEIEPRWFEIYGKVATTGEAIRFEEFSATLNRWFDLYAFRVGEPQEHKVAVLFTNITDRKQVEAALRKSEERFRALVTATSEALYRMSPDWKEMRQLNGGGFIPDTEGPNPSWLAQYIPEDDQARVRAVIDQAIRTKSVFELEHQVRRVDGNMGWTFSRAIPLVDEKGAIVEWFGAASDVTERKRAEERLRQREERFRSITNSTPVMMWMTDADGAMEFVNRAYQEFFGVSLEQVAGVGKWEPLVHPEDRERYVGAYADALRKQSGFCADARVRRADGQWRWIQSYGAPRYDEQGVFLGIAGTSPDITERKEFEAELERLVAERTAKLQELVGELEHFSYTITHDLKAPLRAMKGFADLASEMCEECARSEAKGFLGRISRAAERMDALIRDALSYSQAVRQELPVDIVDTGALVRGMLDSYPEFQTSRAQIQIEGRLPVVLANEAGLTQCFSNLLGNAVKFVKPGETPNIRIWGEDRDGWARIWVEDQGIGISKEMLPRVFDMFSRASNSYDGTGIGLALVRKVIQRMGGKVGVESDGRTGSRFWIEVKCGEIKESQRKASCATSAGTFGTVLYVEDEESDVLFMERAFAGKGLRSALRVARGGRTAIDYLSGSGIYADRMEYPLPDVVLLDLNLPDVPGFQVLKWMRKHPGFASTPVVVFSSSTREDDRLKAQVLGANEFLVKPKSGMEFVAVVEELQGRWLGQTAGS